MKTDIKNKDIADFVGKSLDTVNGWKQRQPKLLEAVKIGVFCKKNNLSLEDIKSLIELKRKFKAD